MTDINQSIRDAAATNASLLSELHDTDYAPPALKSQERQIEDLEKEISEIEYRITKKLNPITQVRKMDSEKIQHSFMRKFAYKVTGQGTKFEGKISEEDSKYVAALEEEQRATAVRDSLKTKLSDAQAAKADLEPIARRNESVQEHLDALYDNIFEGPTPSFPEEDQKEENVKQARWNYDDVEAKLGSERRAVKLLQDARYAAQVAMSEAGSAESASTWDVMGGGLISDMMEQSSLGKATTAADQFKSLYRQAQQTSPHVQPLNDVQIAGFDPMMDVFFDNIFTDLRMYDNIQESLSQLRHAQAIIEDQIRAAGARIKDLEGQSRNTADQLVAARKDLQDTRSRAFEQVLNN